MSTRGNGHPIHNVCIAVWITSPYTQIDRANHSVTILHPTPNMTCFCCTDSLNSLFVLDQQWSTYSNWRQFYTYQSRSWTLIASVICHPFPSTSLSKILDTETAETVMVFAIWPISLFPCTLPLCHRAAMECLQVRQNSLTMWNSWKEHHLRHRRERWRVQMSPKTSAVLSNESWDSPKSR